METLNKRAISPFWSCAAKKYKVNSTHNGAELSWFALLEFLSFLIFCERRAWLIASGRRRQLSNAPVPVRLLCTQEEEEEEEEEANGWGESNSFKSSKTGVRRQKAVQQAQGMTNHAHHHHHHH